jgi:hypothetical protein
MRKVTKERMRFLQRELREYEKNTEMTDEERKELHEWVADGYSVHENSAMAWTDYGVPCDFLFVYREEELLRKEWDALETLPPRERRNRRARLMGKDTMDNLREDLLDAHNKIDTYEWLLRKNGLLEEAQSMIRKNKEESMRLHMELLNSTEEMPFDIGG